MFGLFALFSEGGLSFWEKIAAWYESSVINELFTYLTERYFSVELGTYENFSVGAGTATTVRNIILALMIGFIAASVMTAYTRQGLGGFVRKLLREECLSPEQAKTLMELGYFRSSMIRRELSRGTTLCMVVRCCEEKPSQDPTPEQKTTQGQDQSSAPDQIAEAFENVTPASQNTQTYRKIDFLTARFYIPEDLRYRADVRFDAKGSSWGLVAVSAVISILAAALLCWLFPDVIALADNIITWLAP